MLEAAIARETLSLEPCPFCGSKAEFVYDDEHDDGTGRVECLAAITCGAQSRRDSREEAAMWWNRRAERNSERAGPNSERTHGEGGVSP
jgi:Lar family restriction alleviation protein